MNAYNTQPYGCVSRGDSPGWQGPHPQLHAELGGDLELAELEFEAPQTWWEEACEWLSGADRHLPHIRISKRKVRNSVCLGPPDNNLQAGYVKYADYGLGKQRNR